MPIKFAQNLSLAKIAVIGVISGSLTFGMSAWAANGSADVSYTRACTAGEWCVSFKPGVNIPKGTAIGVKATLVFADGSDAVSPYHTALIDNRLPTYDVLTLSRSTVKDNDITMAHVQPVLITSPGSDKAMPDHQSLVMNNDSHCDDLLTKDFSKDHIYSQLITVTFNKGDDGRFTYTCKKVSE